MKKIFYVILVVAVLLGIGYFAKQEIAASAPEEEIVVVEEGIINEDINADGEVVEEEAEDVVEVNPEDTADEDETIVEE